MAAVLEDDFRAPSPFFMDVARKLALSEVAIDRARRDHQREIERLTGIVQSFNNPKLEAGETAVDVLVPYISSQHAVRVYLDVLDPARMKPENLRLHHISRIYFAGGDLDLLSEEGKQKVLRELILTLQEQAAQSFMSRVA